MSGGVSGEKFDFRAAQSFFKNLDAAKKEESPTIGVKKPLAARTSTPIGTTAGKKGVSPQEFPIARARANATAAATNNLVVMGPLRQVRMAPSPQPKLTEAPVAQMQAPVVPSRPPPPAPSKTEVPTQPTLANSQQPKVQEEVPPPPPSRDDDTNLEELGAAPPPPPREEAQTAAATNRPEDLTNSKGKEEAGPSSAALPPLPPKTESPTDHSIPTDLPPPPTAETPRQPAAMAKASQEEAPKKAMMEDVVVPKESSGGKEAVPQKPSLTQQKSELKEKIKELSTQITRLVQTTNEAKTKEILNSKDEAGIRSLILEKDKELKQAEMALIDIAKQESKAGPQPSSTLPKSAEPTKQQEAVAKAPPLRPAVQPQQAAGLAKPGTIVSANLQKSEVQIGKTINDMCGAIKLRENELEQTNGFQGRLLSSRVREGVGAQGQKELRVSMEVEKKGGVTVKLDFKMQMPEGYNLSELQDLVATAQKTMSSSKVKDEMKNGLLAKYKVKIDSGSKSSEETVFRPNGKFASKSDMDIAEKLVSKMNQNAQADAIKSVKTLKSSLSEQSAKTTKEMTDLIARMAAASESLGTMSEKLQNTLEATKSKIGQFDKGTRKTLESTSDESFVQEAMFDLISDPNSTALIRDEGINLKSSEVGKTMMAVIPDALNEVVMAAKQVFRDLRSKVESGEMSPDVRHAWSELTENYSSSGGSVGTLKRFCESLENFVKVYNAQ